MRLYADQLAQILFHGSATCPGCRSLLVLVTQSPSLTMYYATVTVDLAMTLFNSKTFKLSVALGDGDDTLKLDF